MPNQEDINGQLDLLKMYRGTLHHYLKQQAQHSQANMPPGIFHGIKESRANIERIKGILRTWDITVEDLPDDELVEGKDIHLIKTILLKAEDVEHNIGSSNSDISFINDSLHSENIELQGHVIKEKNIGTIKINLLAYDGFNYPVRIMIDNQDTLSLGTKKELSIDLIPGNYEIVAYYEYIYKVASGKTGVIYDTNKGRQSSNALKIRCLQSSTINIICHIHRKRYFLWMDTVIELRQI